MSYRSRHCPERRLLRLSLPTAPESLLPGKVILLPGAKGYDLYVKAIGSETLLRLTQHPSEWISPAWSPDGTQIAFHRIDGAGTGIYVVPALGGPERKLRSTRMSLDTGSL